MEETIHGAKRLITSHEGYLWKKTPDLNLWKKRYFALSKGWLFYFAEHFHCNKFKSIAFFSEEFFNQAFHLYVKGSIPLHQTTIEKIDVDVVNNVDEDVKEFVFRIITDKKEFYFATANQQILDDWFQSFHVAHSPPYVCLLCMSVYANALF